MAHSPNVMVKNSTSLPSHKNILPQDLYIEENLVKCCCQEVADHQKRRNRMIKQHQFKQGDSGQDVVLEIIYAIEENGRHLLHTSCAHLVQTFQEEFTDLFSLKVNLWRN